MELKMELSLNSMADSICHVIEIIVKITTFRVFITKNGDALTKDYIILVLEIFPKKDHN